MPLLHHPCHRRDREHVLPANPVQAPAPRTGDRQKAKPTCLTAEGEIPPRGHLPVQPRPRAGGGPKAKPPLLLQ